MTFDDDQNPDLLTGADGRARCVWAGADPEYVRYHDEEWGMPLRTDRQLFEKLSLEGFQAGLSWLTVLRKRPAFREAFDNFEPATVANYTDADIERLLSNDGIIRNRAKIAAVINNAQVVAAMSEGAFTDLMWSQDPAPAPAPGARPRTRDDVPSTTAESIALSQELRARGFKFIGPTILYALMQASGMVDDHLTGCWRAGANAQVA